MNARRARAALDIAETLMKILLISFYNPKALGLRCLEKALQSAGHEVQAVFFKGFNSVNPQKATGAELDLLRKLTEDFKPGLIGLSVMASHYLETVFAVSAALRGQYGAPVVWGGTYATMFPEEALKHSDYVIRGEGEEALLELAAALEKDEPADGILNLAYPKDGGVTVNDLRPLQTDLDRYGPPNIGGNNKALIENGVLIRCDPQLTSFSYETGAGRGCPYTCSYCCSVNINRLYAKKGPIVRLRDPDAVIEELKYAVKNMKKLVTIHFWDEIFAMDKDWVDRFTSRYQKEIRLPFAIWGHPLCADPEIFQKLRKAGLHKVVMGIQSGSPTIRRDVFHRRESQDAILKAANTLKDAGVPRVIYDLMLRHPFETAQTIRETFDFCLQLPKGFSLNMHGLNFLPGTDIVAKAIEQGLVTPDEMEKMMSADLETQYQVHWSLDSRDEEINFWYHLIYLTQFGSARRKAVRLALNPASAENRRIAEELYHRAARRDKRRSKRGKVLLALRGLWGRLWRRK
jgi:radical SAM superfamily enzyme YgiQ (UPF0313 family)